MQPAVQASDARQDVPRHATQYGNQQSQQVIVSLIVHIEQSQARPFRHGMEVANSDRHLEAAKPLFDHGNQGPALKDGSFTMSGPA